MTMTSLPPGLPLQIRYVDLPRHAVSVRRHRILEAARRVAIIVVAAVTLVVAGIGFTMATQANDRPSGYATSFDRGPGLSDPASTEAVQWRPSLVPLR
jgi:hypothetical protein